MKKHLTEIILVACVIAFAGIVTYVFKNNPTSTPPKYALTSQAPVVSVDDKGQIFVRTDCTIEEYRNTIGSLAKEILTLRTAQQPKATEPTVK